MGCAQTILQKAECIAASKDVRFGRRIQPKSFFLLRFSVLSLSEAATPRATSPIVGDPALPVCRSAHPCPMLTKVAEANFPSRFGHFRIYGFEEMYRDQIEECVVLRMGM